ncbi:neutral cholesterol ester hydrolase 1-like [Mizuhopecten yessoensis]|uniref:Arylacetamide deacetylase n=1 Tax=Mizuhopecten yessoensis TaxID=6573 RepID=A0A210PGK1_MIZYE|nr:neutral cholesterol ester hydrolase 1-like [Mizuhopecten yessoensis]OWF35615.1 Arylacetamide deacetylase [Mizuhopecten yessoensis]
MIRLTLFGALLAWFLYSYLDGKIPEPIPEQFTVKLIDASMKTYGHTMGALISLGVTTQFSDLDRAMGDRFILLMTTGFPWSLGADPQLQITNTTMSGVHVRIYEPVTSLQVAERPVLVYFHGGGWSMLSVDSYDPLMRKIARDSGIVVISVNYRLSPQYPYPVPLQDCSDVVEYVIENCATLSINPRKIAIGGDSAGGNIAVVLSYKFKYKLALQIVLVPVLQMANWNTTSFIENAPYLAKSINSPDSIFFVLNYLNLDYKYGQDFLKNNHTSSAFKKSHYMKLIDQNRWVPKQYIRDKTLMENIELQTDFGNEELFSIIESRITNPLMSPLLAGDDMLTGLPLTYVATSGYDFIRDDGIMFAERLKHAGQEVVHQHYHEAFHNSLFFAHGPLKLDVGVRIVQDIVNILRNTLL